MTLGKRSPSKFVGNIVLNEIELGATQVPVVQTFMQFDHFLFVVQDQAVTVYLNGARQSTHPHGIIDLTLERESLVHMGRVEGTYQLPEHADQIPDEAWLQTVEQIDHLKPEVVSSERHTLYPSAPMQD